MIIRKDDSRKKLIPTLVIGGTRARAFRRIATNLRQKGLEVRWHWETERKQLPTTSPPAGCGAVVVLRDLMPHCDRVKQTLDRCGLPVVWTTRHWSQMVRDLDRLKLKAPVQAVIPAVQKVQPEAQKTVEVQPEPVGAQEASVNNNTNASVDGASDEALVDGAQENGKMAKEMVSLQDLAVMSGLEERELRDAAGAMRVDVSRGVPDEVMDALVQFATSVRNAGRRKMTMERAQAMLKAWRAAENVTQRKLAGRVEALGVKCRQEDISKVERQVAVPLEMMMALAAVTGLDLPVEGLSLSNGGVSTDADIAKVRERMKVLRQSNEMVEEAGKRGMIPTADSVREVQEALDRVVVQKDTAPIVAAPKGDVSAAVRKVELLNQLRDVAKELLREHNAKEITISDEGITITPREAVLKIAL